MLAHLTDRQRSFVEMAASHADDFAQRVAQHDREASFPFENLEAMKASGYTTITVPEELGGGGANPLELSLAQHRLAQGDGPTAISINMHLFIMGIYGDLWRRGVEEVRPVLEAAVRDKAIRCAGSSDPAVASAVSVGGLNESSRKAVRVKGGYLVSGRSAFNTLSVAADLIGTTAHYDDPEKGPMVVSFTVPTTSPGIHIRDNWDTMGIRASASNDIIWEEVYVPDQIALLRPTRTWTVFNNLFSSWFNTSVPSVYLGVAQAARDYAVAGTGDRTQYPYQQPNKHSLAYQLQAAEMEVPLRTALGMMRYTAGLVEDAEARTDPPLADIVSCQRFVTETAVEVVDRAMRLMGGAAMFRNRPLEQMYRDVRAGMFHQPLAGQEGMAFLGRLVFGLQPYPPPEVT